MGSDPGAQKTGPNRLIYEPLVTEAFVFPESPIIVPVRGESPAAARRRGRTRTTVRRAGRESIAFEVRSLSIAPEPVTEHGVGFAWTSTGLAYSGGSTNTRHGNEIRQDFVVFDLPDAKEGDLVHVSGAPVLLRLVDPGTGSDASIPDWVSGPAQAWPDPNSPMETFRRRLRWQQSSLGTEAGEAPDEFVGFLARDNAQRWGAGLKRLRSISPGVHATLIEVLTRVCEDGPERFAAWPVNPGALAELEARLLSPLTFASEERDLATWALAWAEEQPESIAWIESDHGDQVRLAIANLTTDRLVAEVQWGGSSRPPTALVIDAQSVERSDRPRPAETRADTLRVRAGNRTWFLRTNPPTIKVRPPGAQIAVNRPMWTQASWLAGAAAPMNTFRAEVPRTTIILRPADEPGQWELFIDCESPNENANNQDIESLALGAVNDWDRLAGLDAVTLFVGPIKVPDAVYTITPSGEFREWMGAEERPVIEGLARREGRWVARITLPESWTRGGVIDLGFMRTHDSTPRAEQFPHPSLPWRVDPGRTRFDLSAWDPLALPNSEE